MPIEDIWDRVEEFRNEYINPTDTVPVPIEEVLEIIIQIEPIPIAQLEKQTGVDGFLSKDFTQIYIDEYVYNDQRMLKRLRFTYAHELAHLVLHRSFIDNIEISSEQEWIDFRTGLSENDLSRFEFQAYEFAGRLLVPKKKLIEQLENKRPEIEKFIETFKPYSHEELISAVSRVICDIFVVSEGVISRRIVKEDIWDELEFEKNKKNL